MKKYENLIKACCVLCLSTPIIGILIFEIFDFPNTDEFWSKYLAVVLGIFFFFGVALILLMIFAPKQVQLSLMRGKRTDDPYKAHAEYTDFNELKNTITAHLTRKRYKLYQLNDEYLQDNLFIYYKHIWFDTRFFIIAYPGYLNNEKFLTEVSCTVNLLIREIANGRSSHLFVTSVHCVNQVSDAFFERLKETYVFNPIYEYEIRAGYSLEDQTLYIGAPFYGDAGILPVKRLRRKLLRMLGIPKKELKK